jgi:riboflavin kinase / FMN adenylyltransferase
VKRAILFSASGKVVRGNQIGRKLGYPTANILVPDEASYHSLTGVYAARVLIGKQVLYGMANIGFRPTLDKPSFTIEVHCFDYEGDMYGKMITIEFLDRIRNEEYFANLTDLTDQMKKDELVIRRLFNNPDANTQ